MDAAVSFDLILILAPANMPHEYSSIMAELCVV